MRRLLLFGVLLGLCSVVSAGIITFEDLTVGDTYVVGDVFMSGGASITGAEYFYMGGGSTVAGTATVQAAGAATNAGGTGNEMWLNNINLAFDFSGDPCGGTIAGLALQYGYYGGDVNLEINGVQQAVANFATLNGTVIGGVMVSVIDTGTKGAIFATGAITSFSIGGQELAIDNLIACVPEPASLILLGLGGVLIATRKR